MRIVLVAARAPVFQSLHTTCVESGHTPVAYVYARSPKPGSELSPTATTRISEIVEASPRGMDVLLPGAAGGIARSLVGHRPDLIVVYGLPWRLPRSVLDIPRLGAINVHASSLPRYRGPIPVHWAIRNGDPDFGVTVHRMTEEFDAGHVLAAKDGLPIHEDQTFADASTRIERAAQELLGPALARVADGEPGEPQDERLASYAGWMEPAFSTVDWSWPAERIHNQVRTFRYGMPSGPGPLADVGGEVIRVLRTSLAEDERAFGVPCADGLIWITEWEPVSREPVRGLVRQRPPDPAW
ncbi:MAG: methionyl-tRNA formyltransferase [Saccharothrix sp.]|nr:methionyl-tRNA formyltransferase [Saccharothrix sp.]